MTTMNPNSRLDKLLPRCLRDKLPRKKLTALPQWPDLPLEIRLMILSFVAAQKHRGWSALASVCREWQETLEKVNFRKIKLRPCDLKALQGIVTLRRREMVCHILLEMELPTYVCTCCEDNQADRDVEKLTFNATTTIFSILGDWEPSGSLALELNMYSPSDSKCWFKNIILSSDDTEPSELGPRNKRRHHDRRHGWYKGAQIALPPQHALMKLHEPARLNLLPETEVTAVTSFILRRQIRRYIDPNDLATMVQCLSRVENITYEPWAVTTLFQGAHERMLSNGIMNSLPQSLKSLRIFEDAHKFYDRARKRHRRERPPTKSPPHEHLVATLAGRSLDLEHLSISFLISAEDFFRHCQPTWQWEHLESLVLTSDLLTANAGRCPRRDALLCQARMFIQQMPKLRRFIIWNGDKGVAGAWIYVSNADDAGLVWRGTWELDVGPNVYASWGQTVMNKRIPCLYVARELVDQELINCHADAIYHMELPGVVHPASLWQMRREVHP